MKTNNTNGYVFDATEALSPLFNNPVGVIGYASEDEVLSEDVIRDIFQKLSEKLNPRPDSSQRIYKLPSAYVSPPHLVSNMSSHKGCFPEAIHRNGKTTTVIWNDGTHTVVNLRDDNDDSPYTAFAYALCKKIYGCGMKGIIRMVEDVHTDFIRERREAEKAKRREEQEARHQANLAKKAAEENAKKIGFVYPAPASCPTCLP